MRKASVVNSHLLPFIFLLPIGVNLTSSATAPLASQACGTSVSGGTVAAGTYVAASSVSCDGADFNLRATMGIVPPVCDGCTPPATGCYGSTVVQPSFVIWGNCVFDPVTGLYKKLP